MRWLSCSNPVFFSTLGHLIDIYKSHWSCNYVWFIHITTCFVSFLRSWIPWNLSFCCILFHEKRLQTMLWRQSQFTPKMKANPVPRLLSSLVWIDQYNECDGMTSFKGFMRCWCSACVGDRSLILPDFVHEVKCDKQEKTGERWLVMLVSRWDCQQ